MNATTKTITTLRDMQERDALIEATMDAPEIGELCRKGKAVFYCYIDGVYFERYTRAEIAAKIVDAGGTSHAGAR